MKKPVKKKRKRGKTLIAWKAARKAMKTVDKFANNRSGGKRFRRATLPNKRIGGGGRPTFFQARYCRDVVELGKEGKSPTQMASIFGVARSTLARWRKDHPPFKEAFDLAMVHAQAFWEAQLHVRVMTNERGAGPAVTALTFMLARRFGEDYREMKELTGAKGTPFIPIGADLPTKEKVRAYMDAVKGGDNEDEDL